VISHENCDYPNRGSSKYIMTINCIDTTTHVVNICLQTSALYACNFVISYEFNKLQMSSFYTTFCGQTKHVICIVASVV
jgi:hypothetical protein